MNEYTVEKHPVYDNYVVRFPNNDYALIRGEAGAIRLCNEFNKLQAQVKALIKENKYMQEQINHHCIDDCCCDWCIAHVARQEEDNETN